MDTLRVKCGRMIEKEYDVVVAGGGLAGMCAAIAAARKGMKTALINNRPVLGGNASSEVGININGACYNGYYPCSVYARETGIIEEIKQLIFQYEGYRDCKGAGLDAALFDMIYREKNIELFLNTQVVDAEKEGNRVKSITALGLLDERAYSFYGKVFVDASGDGIVAERAGAAFMFGTEARSEFGEDLAPQKAKRVTHGSTVMFHTVDAGRPEKYVRPAFAYDITKLPFFNRLGTKHRTFYKGKDGLYHGFWWVEYGGDLDVIDDNEAITLELRKIVYGLWDYIKNSGRFEGVENLRLVKVCPLAGKRESRRFIGDYILTQNDIRNKTDFPDSAYVGGWPMDVHADKGIYDEDVATNWNFVPGMYNAPFRTLYAKDFENLFLAGRITSCSRVANGSTRVMATCAATGQAVGTAAAMCINETISPRRLCETRIGELQKQLVKDDQTLVGRQETYDLNGARATSNANPPLVNGTDGSLRSLNKNMVLALPLVKPTEKVYVRIKNTQEEEQLLTARILLGTMKECYLPEKCAAAQTVALRAGFDGEIALDTASLIGKDQKIYLAFSENPALSLYVSATEMTGAPSFTMWERTPDAADPRRYVLTRTHDNIAFRTSEREDIYGAENVLSGYNRPYGLPNICIMEKKGAFLRIDFEEKFVREIRLIFNTDLAEDIIYSRCPKLIKDFKVKAEGRGFEREILVEGNFDRMCSVAVGGAVSRVIITPLADYGSEYYEIYGVKIY